MTPTTRIAKAQAMAKEAPKMYAQCTILIAKENAQFINSATNRVNKIRAGAEYWIASSITEMSSGNVEIYKASQPKGAGFWMPSEQVDRWFELARAQWWRL